MTRTPRRQAREAALQALYFWEVGRTAPDDAIDAVFPEYLPDATDAVRAFAEMLVRGAVATHQELDALIEKQSSHWRLERLAVIDKSILRLAVWELQHQPETPAAVVLNEALELARTFSGDESVKFVNGVLDGIRRSLNVE
ncbi:MAG TPA: transcription antitermination factor NusB [Vicinamibacterales bacterium]|nr:transcription antitermination factor NusB [Vicinamibacterales bacterium]